MTEPLYRIFWKDHALERLVDWKEARNIVVHHMATHKTDPVWLVPVTDHAELQRMLKHVWLHQHGAPEDICALASTCASLDELWCRSNLPFLLWIAQRVLSKGQRHRLAASFTSRVISDNIGFEPGRARQMWMSYVEWADPIKLDGSKEFDWTDSDIEALRQKCTEPGHYLVVRAIAATIHADVTEAAMAARESTLARASQLHGHAVEREEEARSYFNAWYCREIRVAYTPNWLLPPAVSGGAT